MRPTEQLKQEHQAIKVMLKILEEVCRRLESGTDANPEHLKKMVDFIRVFADRCHHGKEEDLLFPAMEQAGVPKEGGPIGVMLKEHQMGRDYVQGMSDAADGYKRGDAGTWSSFVENARGYIALLTPHINKEDNVLYVMADAHLSKETQDRLLEEFECVEREKIGPGKHQELHRLLDDLKEVYLK